MLAQQDEEFKKEKCEKSKKVISENNLSENVAAIDVYKAVYFAVTYTIMDGLPFGPQS